MIKSTFQNFATSLFPKAIGDKENKYSISTEILAGLTVALALVPEAVAFAFVAGVNPLIGLYAAFFIGLITAIFGGRPGMISGATGALAVVMVSLVSDHGVQYLFATVILMGVFQVIAGVFRLGKFIRLVPHPVMLGFVNGLAVVIFLSQLGFFLGTEEMGGMAIDISLFAHGSGDHIVYALPQSTMIIMIALVALTMAVIWGLPKFTTIIPAPLAGILITALIVIIFDLPVMNVGDFVRQNDPNATIAGGFPKFMIPSVPFNLETLRIILPYSLILGSIGLIESLLTLNLVNEMRGERGGASQECVAQGSANIVTGFFGGMGGCAMIGQSIINVNSGARTRISAIAAALFLLSFILWASSFIEQIPIAALVGVMFMVVIGTFAWNSIRLMMRVPFSDFLVIIVVTIVTVLEDLAVAVIVGVILSALIYAWKAAAHIHAVERPSKSEKGAKVYEIEGPLFFGSSVTFLDLFHIQDDPDHVIVDFARSRVVDQSALQAIEALATKYKNEGKRLQLRHLSRDCHKLLATAGQLMVESDDDPDYAIAVDYDVRLGRIGDH